MWQKNCICIFLLLTTILEYANYIFYIKIIVQSLVVKAVKYKILKYLIFKKHLAL